MDKFLSRQEVLEKAIRMILVPMASMCQKDLEETLSLCYIYNITGAEIIEQVHKRRTGI
jgi:hypothetical protein